MREKKIPLELIKKWVMFAPLLCANVMVKDQEYVLLVKRSIEPQKGKWCLPGGIMEKGCISALQSGIYLNKPILLFIEKGADKGIYFDNANIVSEVEYTDIKDFESKAKDATLKFISLLENKL